MSPKMRSKREDKQRETGFCQTNPLLTEKLFVEKKIGIEQTSGVK